MGADLAHVREAREWAWRVARDAGLDGDACRDIRLATSEVVANAIEHGPGGDTAIVLEAFERDGALIFELRGGGRFDLPDGRVPVDGERGRGLEIVGRLMDALDVEVADDGTSVRYSRRLG